MDMRHTIPSERINFGTINFETGLRMGPAFMGSLDEDSIEYSCDMCEMKYEFPSQLTQHQRTHSDSKPHVCTICLKSFVLAENLSLHYAVHTRLPQFKCNVCEKSFEHPGKLHRHMRVHSGERAHQCNLCNKSFIQRAQLVIHMRSHTGSKPYLCGSCPKAFTCSKQLKVHQRIHTGEKPFKCELCHKSFGYSHVLKLHQVQHFGCRVYKCTICNSTFKSKKVMEQHIISHESSFPRPSSCGSSSNHDSLDKDYPVDPVYYPGRPSAAVSPVPNIPGLLPSINSIYMDEEIRQLPRPEPRTAGIRGCSLVPVTTDLIDSLLEEDHAKFGSLPVLPIPSLGAVLSLTNQDEPMNLSLGEEKCPSPSTPPTFANMKSSCLPPRKRRLVSPDIADEPRISVIQFAQRS